MKDSALTIAGWDASRPQETPKTAKGTRRSPIEAAADRLPAEVLESIWLDEIREGKHARVIARREGVTPRCVQLGVARARLRELAKAQTRGADLGDAEGRSTGGAGASPRDHPAPRVDAKTMPRLLPLFPIGSFTPASTCGHREPIRAGSIFCCMVCHASGLDDHPGLERDPLTEPEPEPAPGEGTAEPKGSMASGGTGQVGRATSAETPAETRAERRRRRYAAPAMAC